MLNALQRLQSAILFQAAGDDDVVAKMTDAAREFIALGAIAVVAAAANPAHAQTGPLTPSNCATAGAGIGGVLGSTLPKSSAGRAVGAIAGALAGAAAGYAACSPEQRPRDSSYSSAERYGLPGGADQYAGLDRRTPKADLSISERARLDQLSKDALDAKVAWKKSLWEVDQARDRGFAAAVTAAMEGEAQARHRFESQRSAFSTTVARMHAGGDGFEPKAVGRYLEISASLLELSTETRTSYRALQQRDEALMARSPTYMAEVNNTARLRQP